MTTIVRPIDPATGVYISQHWGVVNGVSVPGGVGGHSGTDYAIGAGTPIRAMADGVVLYAGPADGFGDHAVALWHPELNVSTTYGHGQAHFVNTGDNVAAGQTIAEVDSQGYSTGNHLHAEIREGQQAWGGNPPNFDIEQYLVLHEAIATGAVVGAGVLTDKDRKAIKFLQHLGGVAEDGVWGPATDRMYQTNRFKLLLLKGDAKTFPRPNPTKPSSFVKEAQRGLFHFAAADQDGWWGPATDSAFELCRLCWKDK